MESNHYNIPLHVPDISESEIEAVIKALRARNLTGDGPETKKAQDLMSREFNVKHVLLTSSCTHAMELAIMVANLGPGDEVIMPSFTFTSTANAVILQGARPVFAEIEMPTLTLDPKDIESRITPRTKAIMPVHYAGISARMYEIMEIAAQNELIVIEDAAQGVGAKYNGRYLGTIGDIGCYSFHGTKNFTCGEGGAFLTNNSDYFRRAEIIREKGTNRQAFLRGEIDKYTWVDKGSSYLLSDIQAALLHAQLARIDELIKARQEIHNQYQEAFIPLAESGKIKLPVIPENCQSNYHIFFLLTNTSEEQNHLLKALKSKGIHATFHYIPLHSSPIGRNIIGCEDDLPLTDLVSKTIVRLPIYPQMRSQDINYVIDNVKQIVTADNQGSI